MKRFTVSLTEEEYAALQKFTKEENEKWWKQGRKINISVATQAATMITSQLEERGYVSMFRKIGA